MSRVVEVVDDEAVDALVAEILDPGRVEPIVAVSTRQHGASPALAVDDVLQALGDPPQLRVIVTGDLTRRLQSLLPDRMSVFGGAARIWWPGVTAHSDPYDHPLVQDRYGVYGTKTLDDLRTAWDKGPPNVPGVIEDASLLLARRERDAANQRSDALAGQLRERTIERDQARERVGDLERRQRERATATSSASTAAPIDDEDVDVDAEVRALITAQWIQALATPQERNRHPLAPYMLRPRFVEEISVQTASDRDRVAWVCAMVLTGRAAELAGLDLHPLRTGAGGEDPQRVRDDGAKAWRCAVRRNTPGAPRLHFWRREDGVIDFEHVGHHDSF